MLFILERNYQVMKQGKSLICRAVGMLLVVVFIGTILSGCSNNHINSSDPGNSALQSEGIDGKNYNGQPHNTYIPTVNDEGYIVITMPITLLGGNDAADLQSQHEALIADMNEDEIAQLAWTKLIANADGSVDYYFSPEQFERTKETAYSSGQLIDSASKTYPMEFIKDAEYTKIDENGIPWALTVMVDKDVYLSSELMNSFYVTVSPAIYIGMYQVLSGISGDDWAVHITIKDNKSGDIISESDFPTKDK